jgi:hypothetical protein
MKIIWLVLGMVAAIIVSLFFFLKKQLLTKFFSSNSGNQGRVSFGRKKKYFLN